MKNLRNIGNRMFIGVSLIMATGSLVGTALAQKEDTIAKELIRQWVATERLLGEESDAWRVEKSRMSELLKLHMVEMKLLNEELAKTGRSVVEVDGHKADLEAKVSDGVQTRAGLRQFLLKLKPRIVTLEKRFPNALKLQVEESMMQLESVNDETSVREILQATVNVLEQANRFNSAIYQGSESVTIGADTWNAEVIYLGLGRAYFYVGSKAGVGEAGIEGWTWTRNDDIFSEVKKAVEVFKKQKQPQLVELPIRVKP